MDSAEQLERRVLALEARSRFQRVAFVVLLGLLAASIWMPRSEAQQQSDAPPGTGDDRNRERVNIVADEKGGVAIRMKDRRTYVVSSWYLDDQNRGWLEFSDYSQQSTIRRRVGLKGEETITGTR